MDNVVHTPFREEAESRYRMTPKSNYLDYATDEHVMMCWYKNKCYTFREKAVRYVNNRDVNGNAHKLSKTIVATNTPSMLYLEEYMLPIIEEDINREKIEELLTQMVLTKNGE